MLLQSQRRVTAPALARALEVSTRTILRDIDQLSAAGVPLWSERGRHGGFQLQDGWSTQLTGLTETESQALLLAGLPGPATDLGLGAAASSARLKLVASLPADWREQADRVGARLYIDHLDWYRHRDTPDCLRDVAAAVWQSLCIVVQYESWRGTSRRELQPLGLVLKAGAWYVVAQTAGQAASKTYRLSNVQSWRLTPKRFKRPKHFDLPSHWKAATAEFEAGLARLQAQVLASPRAMTWLANARIPFVVLRDAAPAPAPRNDWATVLWPLESIDHGARQLLSFGAEVEVLGPAALRRQVEQVLASALERYRQRPRRSEAESFSGAPEQRATRHPI
jgi:predicted DNA-binding transcriptional regulator YafY